MGDLNLDPAIDEEVGVKYRPGIFRVTRVYLPGEEHPNPNLRTSEGRLGMVDLRREGDGFELPGIPWHRLTFEDETRPVRRAIEWLRTNPEGRVYPEYIQDYEVTAGEDHAGNPSIFVRFLVDPNYIYENGRPAEEKVARLNEFLDDVRTTLNWLNLDRWTYVRAGEARRALDVAS
jgi:hypothetical protein